ncbi:MAG: hypothetical protein GY882_07825 [Actinomycetia bacterium]|nr:hypothetical protein [Actinomycetes bacterium]
MEQDSFQEDSFQEVPPRARITRVVAGGVHGGPPSTEELAGSGPELDEHLAGLIAERDLGFDVGEAILEAFAGYLRSLATRTAGGESALVEDIHADLVSALGEAIMVFDPTRAEGGGRFWPFAVQRLRWAASESLRHHRYAGMSRSVFFARPAVIESAEAGLDEAQIAENLGLSHGVVVEALKPGGPARLDEGFEVADHGVDLAERVTGRLDAEAWVARAGGKVRHASLLVEHVCDGVAVATLAAREGVTRQAMRKRLETAKRDLAGVHLEVAA